MIRLFNVIYNELINSNYLKNIFVLTSGVGFSQIIPLLLLPILTRFFTPSDFGVLAIFLALIQLIAISSTFRLEMAVILPKKDTDAAILCLSAFLSLFIISFFIFCVFIFLLEFVLDQSISSLSISFFQTPSWFDQYLPLAAYLIPLAAFFLGIYNILYSWNNRLELYRNMSYSHITHSLFSTPLSILFYFSSLKIFALILGQLIGRILACVFLFTHLIKTIKTIPFNTFFIHSCPLVKKYRKFVIFETPHAIINFCSQKLILGVFTALFGLFTVGIFDLADKMIAKPLGVISNSFKTVFYKRLTTAKDKITIFKKSILLITCISFCFTIPFYIIPDYFFAFILGSEWVDTGVYIRLLCPLLFSRFIFNVVMPSISYTLQNHYLLIWQIVYLILLVAIFFILRDQKVERVLLIYAVFGAFMYAVLGLISFMVLKRFK